MTTSSDSTDASIATATLALAERFMTAIETGDIDTVRTIYAPDARIWHNYDGIEQTADENLRVLKWMARVLPQRHYEDVRRHVTPDGWAQQHVLRGQLRDGSAFEMPAALFVTLTGDRISRLDEYLDPAQAAVLSA